MEAIDLTDDTSMGLDVSYTKAGFVVVKGGKVKCWGYWLKPAEMDEYQWSALIYENLKKLRVDHSLYSCTVIIEEPLKRHGKSSMPTAVKLSVVFGMVYRMCLELFNDVLHP